LKITLPALGRRWDPVMSLELGMRSSYASGRIAPVENQTVGYARLAVGDHLKLEYANDHRWWWWPMGDGGDQGNTMSAHIWVDKLKLHLRGTDWNLDGVGAHMRLASGIPDRDKHIEMGGRTVYVGVAFDEISQGAVSASATFRTSTGWSATFDLGADTAGIRDAAQNKLVHKPLNIPEFVIKQVDQPYFSLTVSRHF